MKVVYHSRFWEQAARLPDAQQRKLAKLLELLQDDPYDDRLHTKKLSPPLEGHYSFRITRDWRAQFRFLDGSTVFCITVKHRKDIYR